MSAAFLRFSSGILFVLFDLRIASFDVLPDVAGYLLWWSAIRRLGVYRKGYLKAEPYAVILAILSLADIIPVFSASAGTSFGGPVPLLLYGGLLQLLMLAVIHLFLAELHRHAVDAQTPRFAAAVDGRRKFYAGITAASLILMPFSLNWQPSTAMIWAIAAGVLGIIALLAVFFTCRRAARELPGHPRPI